MAARPTPTFWCETDTPVGRVRLAGSAEGLSHVQFESHAHRRPPPAGWREDEAPLARALVQLCEYFSGVRRSFTLRLAPQGTPFQRLVWNALCAIPYGETLSYAELARRIGRAGSARAVGLANGANPLPIVIPCHRVIGADGSLRGFGGGLDIKRALLALEGAACVADLFSGPAASAPAPGGPGRRS